MDCAVCKHPVAEHDADREVETPYGSVTSHGRCRRCECPIRWTDEQREQWSTK